MPVKTETSRAENLKKLNPKLSHKYIFLKMYLFIPVTFDWAPAFQKVYSEKIFL